MDEGDEVSEALISDFGFWILNYEFWIEPIEAETSRSSNGATTQRNTNSMFCWCAPIISAREATKKECEGYEKANR